MNGTTVVAELHKELLESQNQRDKRIEGLWRTLGPNKKGELDLKGLQKGLRKIDHPMANADGMLRKIMQSVDSNSDGRIQYSEFRSFMDHAETQLMALFRSIDRNSDGRLERDELRSAFRKAGVTVPTARLNAFFDELDRNNDGFVTFEEWRDFLLFMPSHSAEESLNAVLSFYTLSSEGDSLVSDETLEGLGTTHRSQPSLMSVLFGSLFRRLYPKPPIPPKRPATPLTSQPPVAPAKEDFTSTKPKSALETSARPIISAPSDLPARKLPQPDTRSGAVATASDHANQEKVPSDVVLRLFEMDVAILGTWVAVHDAAGYEHRGRPAFASPGAARPGSRGGSRKPGMMLTDLVPPAGYFFAGALAGGVSRTATAPLDRLKVYLLVSTKTNDAGNQIIGAIRALKPITAIKIAASPFHNAVKDIWAAGGARNFFAGNALNVVKIMPETAIKFGSYEATKRAIANFEGHGDPKKIHPYAKFAAGGIAGMIAQFFVYPLDTLKFRLQCETTKDGPRGNALLLQTAKKMMAEGAIRTAYRGVTMGLVGMFPYSAIDMGTFEFLKTSYRKYKARKLGVHPDDVQVPGFVTGAIGASSGAIGASIVYPLNVLRTRLQTQGTVMHQSTYNGIVDVAIKTVQREGYKGLYKGLTPNLLKVAPALSITWLVYEKSKKFMNLD